MPLFSDNCSLKRLFSFVLKHNFNSISVDKVFKQPNLVVIVGHEDGVVRTYNLPDRGLAQNTVSTCAKCLASFETKGGPIQALVVHDVSKLSGEGGGDIVTSDSRGLVTVFCNGHILCRKAISDQPIGCVKIDSDAAGNFGIVTADRDGNICSFTPYFDMWQVRLIDIRQRKGLSGRSTVTCVTTSSIKLPDGHTANYVLVADDSQYLYFIQRGTVVLMLQTPAVITAMCSGQFIGVDDIDTSTSPSASQHRSTLDSQVALASNTGTIYIMTNFQIYQDPLVSLHLPINHLYSMPSPNLDVLLAAGNFDSVAVISQGKVLASYHLPTWTSAVAVADIDDDGTAEVIIGCRDNSIHGLKLNIS